MAAFERIRETSVYMIIVAATFVVLQTLVVVMQAPRPGFSGACQIPALFGVIP